MKQYDLNQIRAFVKVVQLGSLTKAALSLKLPKSRLSRWITKLEKDLGAQLLYRTTRQIQVTAAGKNFFEEVQAQILHLDTVGEKFESKSLRMEGRIKLTAPVDFGNTYLPALLTDFSNLYPRIELEVLLSQNIIDLVKESVDVALRIAPLKDSSLLARKVTDLQSIVVVSPSLFSRQPIEKLEELSLASTLSFAPHGVTDWKLVKGHQLHKVKIKPRFISNDAELVRSQALSGKGYAVLPEYLCRDMIGQGKLLHVLKAYSGKGAPLSLVSPAQRNNNPRVKVLTDFLFERLKAIF